MSATDETTPWYGVLAELNTPNPTGYILAHDARDKVETLPLPLSLAYLADPSAEHRGVRGGLIQRVWTETHDGLLQMWGQGFVHPGELADRLRAGEQFPIGIGVFMDALSHRRDDGTLEPITGWRLMGATVYGHGGALPWSPSARIWLHTSALAGRLPVTDGDAR